MLFLVWYQEYSLQECLGNTMTLLRLRSKELSMGIRPSALLEGQSLPLSSRALHQFCGHLKLWSDISLENHLNKDPRLSRTLITSAAQTLENRSPDLTAQSTGPGFLTSLKTCVVKKKLFILQTRASMGTQITLHRPGSKVLDSHMQDQSQCQWCSRSCQTLETQVANYSMTLLWCKGTNYNVKVTMLSFL